MTEIQRSMPFSDDAEKGLLSCFLQNPSELIADALQDVPRDSFYHPAHRLLYDRLCAFHAEGRPVDLVSLSSHFIDSGEMDKIGGPATLTDLLSFVPTSAHYGYYKGILKDKYLLRRIIGTCTEAIQAAYEHSPNEPAANALDAFEQAVIKLRQGQQSERWVAFPELVDRAVNRYEQAILNGGQLPGIPTGYRKLDAVTGGMREGQVWTIGGGTSDGKSAFIQNIITHLGRHRVPTCVYTLEMTADENVDRFFCIQSCIPGHEYLYGLSNRENMKTAMEAAAELRQWPLTVMDVSGIKIAALRADMRSQVRRHGTKVFALDYLQLVGADSKGHNREREVAEISAAMKAEAKLLKATVLNLSQLNDDGRLRESRAIGQDSDVVALLRMPLDEEKKPLEDQRELVLAKVRGGRRGEVLTYDFHGPTYTFRER